MGKVWVRKIAKSYIAKQSSSGVVNYDTKKLPTENPEITVLVEEYYQIKAELLSHFLNASDIKTPSTTHIYIQAGNRERPSIAMQHSMSQITGINNSCILAIRESALEICTLWLATRKNYDTEQCTKFKDEVQKLDRINLKLKEALGNKDGLPVQYQLNAIVNGNEVKKNSRG